jgi:hypothetical protein
MTDEGMHAAWFAGTENGRRIELAAKRVHFELSGKEREELDRLQGEAHRRSDAMPRDTSMLDELERRLDLR